VAALAAGLDVLDRAAVDSKFQRSTIRAGAPQAGSGQAMTSAGVRWNMGLIVSGMAASCQSVDRPKYGESVIS